MHPGKQIRSWFEGIHDYAIFVDVSKLFHVAVNLQSVCDNRRARLDRFSNEPMQIVLRCPVDHFHANTPYASTVFLRCHDNHSFVAVLATDVPFFHRSYKRFIYFDTPRQPIPSGPNHGTTQFMQPRPRCSIAAQSQNLLEPKGTGPVFLGTHPPDRSKPHRQRLARPFKYRPGRHGTLILASGTDL